jgi:hypothetical protein
MKKLILFSISTSAVLLMMGGITHAQDQTEVTIQVKKDGKVVKDTTYQFEDETAAKQAVKMFELAGSEGAHEMEFNYTMAHEGGEHANTMVFVSKDGEKTEIKEIHGDSLVWISEEDLEGEPVKVIKYKVKKGEEDDGEHVVVVSSSEGGTFDILIDEELEGAPVKKEKRVKVVVQEGEGGMMHISEEELVESDEEVYVIQGDDVKKELKEIMEKVEDSESDQVKVIVIKKGEKPEKEKNNNED